MAMIRNRNEFTFVPEEYGLSFPHGAWRTMDIGGGILTFASKDDAERFAKDLVRTASNADWPGLPHGKSPLIIDTFEDDKGKWCVHWNDEEVPSSWGYRGEKPLS